MKKGISLVLALMLVFSCYCVAFAGTTDESDVSAVFENAIEDFFANPEWYTVISIEGEDISEQFYSQNLFDYNIGNLQAIKEFVDSNVEQIYKDSYISYNGMITPFATNATKTAIKEVSYHRMVATNSVAFEAAYNLYGDYNVYSGEISSGDDVVFEWVVNPFDMTLYVTIDGVRYAIGGDDKMDGADEPVELANTYSITNNRRTITFNYQFTFVTSYNVTVGGADGGADGSGIVPVTYTFPTYAYNFSGTA